VCSRYVFEHPFVAILLLTDVELHDVLVREGTYHSSSRQRLRSRRRDTRTRAWHRFSNGMVLFDGRMVRREGSNCSFFLWPLCCDSA